MKGYRVKETNIALPHTAKRLLNIIQQKAKYSELNLSGFFYQIIVAILNSSKTATKPWNVNEYKNLPADYLLAAQQGDIDKVKPALRWVSILIPAIVRGKRQLRWQVYISNMLAFRH